jgi:ABC-type multidrug transport system fused ATPase/permease subunit
MKQDNKISEKFGWWDLGRAFLYLVGENKKKYITWTVILIIILVYDLVPPFMIGLIVDFFTKYKQGESLSLFYIYAITLGLSFSLIAYLRLEAKQILGNLRTATECDIKVKGFEKLTSQLYMQHRSENTGSKMQKIQSGVISFGSLTRLLNDRIFSAVIMFCGVTGIFIFLSPIYAVLFCVYAVLFFSIIRYFYKKIQKLNYEKNIAMEKSSGSYIEGLNNILTIKSSGAEESFRDNIVNKEEVVKKHTIESIKLNINQWKVFQVFNGLFILVFLLFIGRDVANGIISIGAIVIYFTYLQRIIKNANQILSSYSNLIDIKVSIARMMPIFWNKHKNNNGKEKFPAEWNLMEMKNVNFTYKKEEQDKFHTGVYDVNFEIKKNSKIGLAGKTGSGKSTLAKLLIGLYPIDSGDYLIDDRNFYNIRNEKMLENISIVLQESEMFNLSLKENITLMHEFDAELFTKAIKIAQLDEVIEKLPKGIDTFIGEKGYHLSGGERQRVGIARAIYRDTQIMIFDEATSSLDNKTETLIQQSLESEMKRKTLIFIAHRIATLKNVDTIYVFKKGKVVEEGNYEELLGDSESEFYRLFKK